MDTIRSMNNGNGADGHSTYNGNSMPFYLRFNWELAGLVRPYSYSSWLVMA